MMSDAGVGQLKKKENVKNKDVDHRKIDFRIFFSVTRTRITIVTSSMNDTIASLTLKTLISETPWEKKVKIFFSWIFVCFLPKKFRTNGTKRRRFERFRNEFVTKMFVNSLTSFSKTIRTRRLIRIDRRSTGRIWKKRKSVEELFLFLFWSFHRPLYRTIISAWALGENVNWKWKKKRSNSNESNESIFLYAMSMSISEFSQNI